MLDLSTALRQGVEVHRRLQGQPPEPAGSTYEGRSYDLAMAAPPQALKPVEDVLKIPEPVAAPAENITASEQPEITFEPEAAPPTVPAADGAAAALLLEQALRRSLRRYPSIQRKEELL